MTAYGPANPNYRHGHYATHDVGEFRAALARDKLLKILTTRCDSRGRSPFTNEETHWAMRVTREQPAWSHDILRGLGLLREEPAAD